MQYFPSLYDHLNLEIPEICLELPRQTLKVKPKVIKSNTFDFEKKNTIDTMGNFGAFLEKSISEINAKLYQSLENSR